MRGQAGLNGVYRKNNGESQGNNRKGQVNLCFKGFYRNVIDFIGA